VKILLVHNFYGSSAPSGENQVFEAECALLRARGNDVHTLTRHSDEIRARGAWGTISGGLATPWNPWMARTARREVERIRPDVVHVHNTFPLISPAVLHAIGSRSARVLTLHNYRLFCSAGIPMRGGKVCVECLDARSSLPAMRYGCYRASRLATLPLALNVGMHRAMGTWTRQVDAFIALSHFQRDLTVRAGLPADKVHVKPNFFLGRPDVVPFEKRDFYAVFVGRLGTEKGVVNLVKAWRAWGPSAPELRIIGAGELRGELERLVAGSKIHILGQLATADAQSQIARARLLVLPSECFEGFPMVVREAFAFGTPAAVSDIGPLPSIVQDGISGVVFGAAQPESLLSKVRAAWETPGLLARMGHGARLEFETKYNEETNYQTLMAIYGKAVEVSKAPK
jgi:glycosyltransferase involved in cell wall biosynthesis